MAVGLEVSIATALGSAGFAMPFVMEGTEEGALFSADWRFRFYIS